MSVPAPTDPHRARLVEAALLIARGRDRDARQLLDALRSEGDALGRVDLQVQADAMAVALDLRDGDTDGAMRRATTASARAVAAGDERLACHARLAVARVDYTIGDHEAALHEVEAVWRQLTGDDDLLLRYHVENTTGIVTGLLGDAERSIDWHLRAQRTAEAAGLAPLAATAMANAAGRLIDIGERAWNEKRPDDAHAAWSRAVADCDAGLRVARDSGARHAELVNLANRTAALAYLGRRDEAMDGFPRVQALAEELGDPMTAVYVRQPKAFLLRLLGDLDGARAEARAAIAAGERIRSRTAVAALYEFVSELDEQAGDMAGALAAYRKFHQLHNEHAADRARARSQALAVRLQTEHALAEAEAERRRATALVEQNRHLSALALQDPLTGLANRRCLDAELDAAHAQAVDGGRPACVALLDVDHFKQVNDRHSHAVGDRVLQRIGELLRHHCRADDLCARYGGEEFALLLHGADTARALASCERLRIAIAEHDWGALAPGLHVTASVGVAALGTQADVSASLAAADARLYAAKRQGRNRVVATDPTTG